MVKQRFEKTHPVAFTPANPAIVDTNVTSLERFKPGVSEQGIRERLLLWYISLKMLKDHPLFGIGPGNFKNYSVPYQAGLFENDSIAKRYFGHPFSNTYHAWSHNEYLQFLAELGILGSLGIFLLISFVLLRMYYLIRKNRCLHLDIILLMSIIVAFALGCHDLHSFPLSRPAHVTWNHSGYVHQGFHDYRG